MSGGLNLWLGAADDFVFGSVGDDLIRTGGGNDRVVASAGDDRLDGESGDDTITFNSLRNQNEFNRYNFDIWDVIGPEGHDFVDNFEYAEFIDGRFVTSVNSPEATVFRMYRSTFERDPEQLGLEAWTTALAEGLSVWQMGDGFAASTEFLATYGALSNRDFVELMYVNVLERPGEKKGVDGWTAALDSGQLTRGMVLAGFSESAENIERLRPDVEAGMWNQDDTAASVARLYRSALDRNPDPTGLASWIAAVDNGASLKNVASSFAASREFQERYGAITTGDFVENLYVGSLGRGSDPTGKAGWVAAIDSGIIDRGDALLGFSESPEHKARTVDLIDDGTLIA